MKYETPDMEILELSVSVMVASLGKEDGDIFDWDEL